MAEVHNVDFIRPCGAVVLFQPVLVVVSVILVVCSLCVFLPTCLFVLWVLCWNCIDEWFVEFVCYLCGEVIVVFFYSSFFFFFWRLIRVW